MVNTFPVAPANTKHAATTHKVAPSMIAWSSHAIMIGYDSNPVRSRKKKKIIDRNKPEAKKNKRRAPSQFGRTRCAIVPYQMSAFFILHLLMIFFLLFVFASHHTYLSSSVSRSLPEFLASSSFALSTSVCPLRSRRSSFNADTVDASSRSSCLTSTLF